MNEPNKIPEMITVPVTSDRYGLSPHFVRRCVANGDVVSVRAGRKILINADSMTAFLNTGVPQGAVCWEAAPRTENTPRIAPISLR